MLNDPLYRLFGGQHRGIQSQAGGAPGFVVTGDNLLPVRQNMAANIRHSVFHAIPMLHLVGAGQFYLQKRHGILGRDLSPRMAGNGDGIHRIGNHHVAQPEVIRGNGVRHQISGRPYIVPGDGFGANQRLFN